MIQEQLTILLVDDDLVDRKTIRRVIRASGLNVIIEEATDGSEAFAALEQTSFDCILLDYRLPSEDGLAVVHAVRGLGFLVPIIILTGQGDEQLAVSLLKAGATDYLTKNSLSPERLSQSIRTALRVHRAEMQAAEAEQALRQSVARLRFLAQASSQLGASLETAAIVSTLARLAIPDLADWCAVDLVDGDSTRRLTTHARREADGAWASEIEMAWPIHSDSSYGSPQVLRTGQPFYYHISQVDNPLRTSMFQLGVTTAICVPLALRGRVLGTLSLITGKLRRQPEILDLTLATDLGQRAAIALDNAELYHSAQQAIRMRDEFLSIASHEFKTPLTSLYGSAQLLQRRMRRDESAEDRNLQTVQVIVEQAARLDKMISALLDISRLQIGQFTIQHTIVDLQQLIERLVEEFRPTLDRHVLTVSHTDGPFTIIGDELRLQQVFQNLLQNAVKYSPEGGQISLTLTHQGQSIVVAVQDQGIGIPAEALPHLFRRFYRAANAASQQINGIGIGLYVVNEIISLHEGTIEVRSRESEGSTFLIYLPSADKTAEISSNPVEMALDHSQPSHEA